MWWPCGHKSAGTVDDPTKAEQIKPVAGTQTVEVKDPHKSIDSARPRTWVPGGPSSSARIHIPWGEVVFKVADYTTFRVGPFSITHDLYPGQDPVQASEDAHEKMVEMADKDFDRKLAWVLDKMEAIEREKAKRRSRE